MINKFSVEKKENPADIDSDQNFEREKLKTENDPNLDAKLEEVKPSS